MEGRVVVVGAGPTGLWLACELRLAGVEVVVLEARTGRDPNSKALTVHPRTLEVFACRGVAERFVRAGVPIPSGHFGALDERLDFRGLDTPFPYTLFLPQARTEELLEEHALAVGARVLRGHRVTDVAQDADGVTVTATGLVEPLRAAYVVGCDGTRSTVREAAGIGFPGTDSTTWGWLADVVLDEPLTAPLTASGPDGLLMAVPLPGGACRLVGVDPANRPGTPTLAEVVSAVIRITGSDLGVREARWLSRFGNATRQATAYRRGRVLLAGDAAHQHFPTGGVGLNVGVQDAANLGWKLAETVHGTAPDGLLDTYHAERHPVGVELLRSTRAQTALMTAHTVEGQALREVISARIADVPEFGRALAESLSALAVAYPAGPDEHPLTGTRAPNLEFADGDLFTLLHPGRPVLLDFTGGDLAGRPVALTGDRPAWAAVRTALIRPDGHVAWAA
ncbi:FAD-dependent monooxygenase [Actinosynnema sp. NPDC002837]